MSFFYNKFSQFCFVRYFIIITLWKYLNASFPLDRFKNLKDFFTNYINRHKWFQYYCSCLFSFLIGSKKILFIIQIQIILTDRFHLFQMIEQFNLINTNHKSTNNFGNNFTERQIVSIVINQCEPECDNSSWFVEPINSIFVFRWLLLYRVCVTESVKKKNI